MTSIPTPAKVSLFAAAGLLATAACVGPQRAAPGEVHAVCHPTEPNRPVCPVGGAPEAVSFLEPTSAVRGAENISLAEHVYVGPFARLLAGDAGGIAIGEASNVQDNVTVDASRGAVRIGERVILAHGSTVKGPAQVGVEGSAIPENADEPEVFLSFGSEVDGAILEINTGVSALARVGPGVRLRSGFLVLPGKNVTTQAEADDVALGKVRRVNPGDVAFNEAVIEVNEAFAREYTALYRADPAFVRGINYDPGETAFNRTRDLPILNGTPTQEPGFSNRIIGLVRMKNTAAELRAVLGSRISLRADEGEPFAVGRIARMGDGVIFHALEESDLAIGDNVTYGRGVIVHGGGRVVVEGQPETQTTIGDNVTLRDGAVVFRSTVGAGSTIGNRSAVVGSVIPPGTVIPDRVIFLNGEIFGPVEW